MKRACVAFLLLAGCGAALADIPSRQLDGSFSKGNPYRDDYPFAERDYDAMEKNPLQIGVKKQIPAAGPEVASITARFEKADYNAIDGELRKKYVKAVRKEFDLTPKEKATVEAYPDEFPVEKKLGKRVQVSEVMKLGDKEYDCNGCRFLAAGDWNGDGVPEVFLRYDDGATHAGAMSEIRVFSEDGAFVWACDLSSLRMGWHGVFDADGDGKVELVMNPGGTGDFVVLGSPKPGETLKPFVNTGLSEFGGPRPRAPKAFPQDGRMLAPPPAPVPPSPKGK